MTKKEGREWAEKKVKEIDAELKKTKSPTLMFSAGSKEYLEDCTWMQRQTINEKYHQYTSFAEWMVKTILNKPVDFSFDSITIEIARKYYRYVQAKVSTKTANNHLKNLKAMWNWHMTEARTKFNPWTHIKKNKGEEHQEYVPPTEDIVAVLLAAKPWQQDYLNIILKTGCRASDPRRLTWDFVNFEQEWIAFWTMKRQGGEKKYRKIAMPKGSTLYDILKRRWNERDNRSVYVFTNPETGTGYVRNAWDFKYMLKDAYNYQKLKDGTKVKRREKVGLCSKAGVKVFTLKSLRHFVALRLDDSGKASLTDIQKLLGHEKATTTDTYLKGLRGDSQRAAAILDDDDLLESSELNQNGAHVTRHLFLTLRVSGRIREKAGYGGRFRGIFRVFGKTAHFNTRRAK
jgi:integrase